MMDTKMTRYVRATVQTIAGLDRALDCTEPRVYYVVALFANAKAKTGLDGPDGQARRAASGDEPESECFG